MVARNRSIDTLRRKRPTEQVEDVALAMPGNLAEEGERNIMMERARIVIAKLPQEQRKTLEMAFFDGLTHSEIAEMTGDPLGTVKTPHPQRVVDAEKGVPGMNSSQHISQDDLALFALQLLEEDELTAALDHMEHCEECRHEVARFQGDLVGYALAQSEMASPPARARERLMKRVAKEKKVIPGERPVMRAAERPVERVSGAVPVAGTNGDHARLENRGDGELFLASRGRRTDSQDEEEPRKRGGAAAFLGWTGWAIAAGMAVAAGLQYRERQGVQNDLSTETAKLEEANQSLANVQNKFDMLTDAGAMQVSLHLPVNGAPEPPKPEGRAAYVADKGALVFIADHLQPLQPYKTYELWLIPADGKDPIPAGTFKPDARGVASVVMPELPKGIAAKMFGVTVEDDGGSKTPTAPIVLAGM